MNAHTKSSPATAGDDSSRSANKTAGHDTAAPNITPCVNLTMFEESYLYVMGIRNTWWYDFQGVEVKELMKTLMRNIFTFEGVHT